MSRNVAAGDTPSRVAPEHWQPYEFHVHNVLSAAQG